MTDKCSCPYEGGGWCDRRGCHVSGIHRRKCRQGSILSVDRLYDGVKHGHSSGSTARVVRASRRPLSDAGTRLLSIVQNAIGRIKCGSCRAMITALNRHRPEDVTTKTLSHVYSEIASKAKGKYPTDNLKRDVIGWINQAFDGSRVVSEEEVTRVPRRKMSVRRAKANPVLGEEPAAFPFTDDPRLNLVMHVWPTSNEMMRWHSERLASVAHRFSRKLLGVAVDKNTMSVSEVEQYFPGWEILEFRNDPKLREVLTYRSMLPMVADEDPNAVTFCVHGKAAQAHTSENEAVHWWTDAMYKTVVQNVDGVLGAMDRGATIVGSFRRHGRHFATRYRWHYSGTFYAVRNALAFRGGVVPKIRTKWWGTESWPGDHFPYNHGHCVFGDNAGELYKVEQQPREELMRWEEENAGQAD